MSDTPAILGQAAVARHRSCDDGCIQCSGTGTARWLGRLPNHPGPRLAPPASTAADRSPWVRARASVGCCRQLAAPPRDRKRGASAAQHAGRSCATVDASRGASGAGAAPFLLHLSRAPCARRHAATCHRCRRQTHRAHFCRPTPLCLASPPPPAPPAATSSTALRVGRKYGLGRKIGSGSFGGDLTRLRAPASQFGTPPACSSDCAA